jgi:transposase InsO family protein
VNCYPFIEAEKAQRRNVKRACELLKVSRAAYYQARRSQPSQRARQDASLTAEVRAVHEESKGRYGAPRIHAQLRAQGRRHSRKRVARLMRQAGLQDRAAKRRKKTTIPDPAAAARADKIRRDFTADAVVAVGVEHELTEGSLVATLMTRMFRSARHGQPNADGAAEQQVRPLVREHGGELGVVKLSHRRRGEHDRAPCARHAVGGGLILVDDDGAQPLIRAAGQPQPQPVPAAGSRGGGQRGHRAPGHPRGHDRSEYSTCCGQCRAARMGVLLA